MWQESSSMLRKRRRSAPSSMARALRVLQPYVLLVAFYFPANAFSPLSSRQLGVFSTQSLLLEQYEISAQSARGTKCFVRNVAFLSGGSRKRRIPSPACGANARTSLAASVAPSSDRSTSSSSSTNSPNQSRGEQQQQPRRQRSHKKRKRYSKRHHIRQLFRRAKDLERKGMWRRSVEVLDHILVLDPTDAHSHLALARLQARRSPNSAAATQAFSNGTQLCPDSIHLWQAWAVHEEAAGRTEHARELFERALEIDPYNPYVCHAYGLMENKLMQLASSSTNRTSTTADANISNSSDNNHVDGYQDSRKLWERALEKTSTAALVCSLGEWFIARRQYTAARELYANHLPKLTSEREQTEVYLAAAWLEERYFSNFDRAAELIRLSLTLSPTNSVAHVALARLEDRRQRTHSQENSDQQVREATARRLEQACIELEKKQDPTKDAGHHAKHSTEHHDQEENPDDGRVYNAWAHLEVKARRFASARKILQRGLRQYPNDFSLIQAAGNVEERMGNYTGARYLYSKSLDLQPSAPTLVAFALLELRRPEPGTALNFTRVKRLFEEALLLDPRHGPAYNAYARCVFEREGDEEKARSIFERGVRAKCQDATSLYHGYAKLELALGNISRARELLLEGRREANRQDIGKDSPHRERALFLTHTLGMLELNSNRPSEALDVFVQGVERYGNSSQLLLGAALSEAKLGNVEKARQLFERSVLNDEKHAHAWQAWGVMEMRAGNFNTAKTLFECGIKSAPRHGPLWHAYAIMESRLGHASEARSLFERGIKKAPNHIPLYQGWASMELREGHASHAKALITEALTRDKRNGAGWLIASDIEKRLGNNGLGKLLLRRGIECSPTDATLYNALGDMLLRERKINEARQIYEKGIEVDPLYAPLYHSLAELEAQVFNVEGLAKLNKRAAAVFNTNALEPPPSSSEVWGTKIRASRNSSVPREVAALAEKIAAEDSDEDSVTDEQGGDPTEFLDKMSSSVLEEGPIRHLLNMEDQEALDQQQ